MAARTIPVVTVWALLASGCASIGDGPRPLEPYTFNCDVPEGRLSRWSAPIRGSNLIRGNVQLVTPRSDPQWAPGANVEFFETARQVKVTVQLVARSRSPGQFEVGLTHFVGTQPPARRQALGVISATGK